MTIKELVRKSHNTAVNNGFWDSKRNMGEMLMLITSELAEALGADRVNHFSRKHKKAVNQIEKMRGEKFKKSFESLIKNYFEDEIADVFIRLGDLCGGKLIDIEKHIKLKMRYNKMREHKHGKKY